MSSSIGDLVTHLIADNSQFSAGLKKAETDLASFSSMAKASLSAIGGVFAGMATAQFAMDAIRAAEEDAAAVAKLDAVLRATGGTAGVTGAEIAALASQLELTAGVADDVTISAAGVLATFKNISGENFKEVIRLAQDLAAHRDIPLQSAVEMLGKALNDPAEGLAKLSRAGIKLTEDQERLVQSLMDVGDTAGAQRVILAELESSVGGVAAATATSSTKLALAFDQVKEAIGNELVPAVDLFSLAVNEARDTNLEWLGTLTRFTSPILTVTNALKGWRDQLIPVKEGLDEIADADIEVVFAEGSGGEEDKGWDAGMKSIQSLADELDVLTGAATAADVQLKKMLEAAGDNDGLKEKIEELHTAIQLEKQLADTKKKDKEKSKFLDDAAEKLRESLKTPDEKLKDEIARLEGLRHEGKITDEELEKAKFKAMEDTLGKPEQSKEAGAVGAAMKGDSAALSAVFAAMRGKDNVDQKQLSALETIASNTDRMAANESSGNNPIELVAGSLS